MTANKARKKAVRAQMAASGQPYSRAARTLATDASTAQGREWGLRYDDGHVRPIETEQHARDLAATLQTRPTVVFREPSGWTQADPTDWKEVGRRHQLKLAAKWTSRGWHLAERFRPGTARGMIVYGGNAESSRGVYLHLVYDTILADRPELTPEPEALDAAREAGDLAAVDAAMYRLDRAARLFLAQEPDVFHGAVKAHAEQLDARSGPTPDWQRTDMLAAYYRGAMHETIGYDGYPRRSGFPVPGVRHMLDAVLTGTVGGYAPGAHVELTGGREVWIWNVQWFDEEDGGPDGYEVLPPKAAPFEIRAAEVVGPWTGAGR